MLCAKCTRQPFSNNLIFSSLEDIWSMFQNSLRPRACWNQRVVCLSTACDAGGQKQCRLQHSDALGSAGYRSLLGTCTPNSLDCVIASQQIRTGEEKMILT